MEIKQQKQIRKFLNDELGAGTGDRLFFDQEKTLNELIANTKGKSKNQMKTLVQTILPRIALYKVLSVDEFSKANAYEYVRKYMIDMNNKLI